MAGAFKRLFEPGYLGKLEIPNRIVMAPMGGGLAELDGRFSRRDIDYYAARARGGAGLIITGLVRVETQIESQPPLPLPRADADNLIPAMADLAEAVHGFGACIAMQLSPGLGRQARITDPTRPPVSASAVPAYADAHVTCRPLAGEEIHAIVSACAEAAGRAERAGFDAVEIHGHSGYLIDQFMSSFWNKRTDEYGGDLDGRLRLPLDIVRAVRKTVGPAFPVIFRLSVDQKVSWGRRVEESQEIARRLEAAGVSALHADAGCYEAIDWIFPPNYLDDACMLDMSAALKQVVTIPVIGVGNLTPEWGESALESGQADFVAFGRGFIADPDWPNKVRRGHREEVRPCIRCNEHCRGRTAQLKTLSCAVNPPAGNEQYLQLRRAEVPARVLVVGGGPAGMEAARVAALRGHRVTLMEKGAVLGGLLTAAATPFFKKELRQMVQWWQLQLLKLGVEVRLNAEVTPETPELATVDSIVVASGGRPLRPPIPGIQGENVVEVLDYHLNRKPVQGDRIIVAGGGLSGCDAALELAFKGKTVTVVEMLDGVARDMNVVSRFSLLRQLEQQGVLLLTRHRVREFRPNGLLAQGPEGNEVTLEADTVITAFGTLPDRTLAAALRERWPEVHAVGDCSRPAKVGDAVRAGFLAGWRI